MAPEMTPEEERRALREKAEELRKVTAQTEERMASLPYNAETEPLRETMRKLMEEVHRMEGNIPSMLEISEKQEIEGGNNNGNH